MPETVTFRGVPYAEARRFEPSRPLAPGPLDSSRPRGPIPPQNPSRLEMVLGPQAPLEQSEDCLVLSVATPDVAGRLPVLVWFHGGANISGGGELPWYDGAGFAREHDVVVVSVTARLGLLGFLRLEGHEGPTLTTGDQLNALDWVSRHIERFGGNPDRVTLAGQSAGATAIETMLRWGVPSGVRGVILQSGYKICEPVTAADASARTAELLDLAGGDVRALPTAEVLDLQKRFAGISPDIWKPVEPADGKPVTVPVVAGWTSDDGLPFAMLAEGASDPAVRTSPDMAASSRRFLDEWFVQGSRAIVSEARAAGHGGWLYEFGQELDEAVPASAWGSPHCVELPYLLGDEQAWRGSPMLGGADWDHVDRLGVVVRREWAHFVHHQVPGGAWGAGATSSTGAGAVDRRYGVPS